MQVYVLKEKVKANIPEETFVVLPDIPAARVDLETSGSQRGWFSVNLQVLWTSPNITPCDMYRLSYILAREIYHHSDLLEIVQEQGMIEN